MNLEFHDDQTVTVRGDDNEVLTVGNGGDRATALHDAWTTLVDIGREDVAAWVARKYKSLTGKDPVR